MSGERYRGAGRCGSRCAPWCSQRISQSCPRYSTRSESFGHLALFLSLLSRVGLDQRC